MSVRSTRAAPSVALRRTCAKLIRFTPDELTRVVERAREARLVPARYIRESALGRAPRARPAGVASDEVVRCIARVGIILRDITPAIRAQDAERGTAFDAALNDLLDVIRRAE